MIDGRSIDERPRACAASACVLPYCNTSKMARYAEPLMRLSQCCEGLVAF
jgi:hypothetical protein